MTFAQLHETIRQEIARRIERGALTGTLLARQTGINQAHISNFLSRKRNLSIRALDLVIHTQMISLSEFIPSHDRSSRNFPRLASGLSVPLVHPATARLSSRIAPEAVLEYLSPPSIQFAGLPDRRPAQRKDWHRFVAVRITDVQAAYMGPRLLPGNILVIDRHDISLRYRRSPSPSIYAVTTASDLIFCYLSLAPGLLILRPHVIDQELKQVQLSPGEPLSTYILGRVCIITSEV